MKELLPMTGGNKHWPAPSSPSITNDTSALVGGANALEVQLALILAKAPSRSPGLFPQRLQCLLPTGADK